MDLAPYLRAVVDSRRDNRFGKLCRWGVVLWTLFCIWGAYADTASVARSTPGELRGFGTTLGLVFWGVMWVVPTITAAGLYALFGRSESGSQRFF